MSAVQYKKNPFLSRNSRPASVSMDFLRDSLPAQLDLVFESTQPGKRINPDDGICQRFSNSFKLTVQGTNALYFLFWLCRQYRHSFDTVLIDTDVHQSYMDIETDRAISQVDFLAGLKELCRVGLIAKTVRPAEYWINPGFVPVAQRAKPARSRTVGSAEHQLSLPI